MARARTRFVCHQCGAVTVKWQGRCTECGEWNSLVEEVEAPPRQAPARTAAASSDNSACSLEEIGTEATTRFASAVGEFDRVTGGGIVPGSLILVGGPPGIGKSTLLLQIARGVDASQADIQPRSAHAPPASATSVLYVSGEESLAQVKMRATRLGVAAPGLRLLAEVELEGVAEKVQSLRPRLVLIDSIQTLFTNTIESAPGSVSQVRECTAALMRLAKSLRIAFIIVGHVTKEGNLAGPRVMEHLVDTVLYFEGERIQNYRILKAVKNRFGSTSEVGLFEMQTNGLAGVPNVSEFFLSQRIDGASGSCIVPVVEGSRSMLVEVQALCNHSGFGYPARRASGIDANRLGLLLAVLDKRGRSASVAQSDVFVNVAGGLEVDETAVDLGVLVAIASSATDRAVRNGIAVVGEVGLGGEVRAVAQMPQRVTECTRMGIAELVMPASNLHGSLETGEARPRLRGVRTLREALDACLDDARTTPPQRHDRGRRNRPQNAGPSPHSRQRPFRENTTQRAEAMKEEERVPHEHTEPARGEHSFSDEFL